MQKKTSKGENIINPTLDEIQILKGLCENLDCTMKELMEALKSNTVSSEIGIQLHYNKYGCHPNQQ